jgi:N-acetylated-alpha-linked acidic dipeptidase
MDRFGDPGFHYHVAAAQIWGTLALRLVDADGLSFDYTDYASEIREFFRETVRVAGRRNLGSAFDEKAMNEAIDDFAKEAERIEKARQDAIKSSERAKLARINDALMNAERQFIDPRGLRGRAWYKHQIYAPGFYTGYAAQPLTDFRQALDERNSANAKESLERIVEAVKRATNTLKQGRD